MKISKAIHKDLINNIKSDSKRNRMKSDSKYSA